MVTLEKASKTALSLGKEPSQVDELGQLLRSICVKITSGSRYCSGVLIPEPDNWLHPHYESTRLILTCAHFFTEALRSSHAHDPLAQQGPFFARGRGFSRRISAVRVIKGTDLAVAHIHEPAPIRRLLPLSTTRIALPTDTITAGFGGDLFAPQPKHGKILALPPYGISRDLRTRVKPAILIYNSVPAIKGDSGAPVIIRRQSTNQDTDQWEITATQSLIVDPLGINLKLATAAALAPHTSAIRQAGHFLLKDQAREE